MARKRSKLHPWTEGFNEAGSEGSDARVSIETYNQVAIPLTSPS